MKRTIILCVAAVLCAPVLVTVVSAGGGKSDAAIDKCITARVDKAPFSTVGIRAMVKGGVAEYAPYLSLPKANRYNAQLRKIARGCGATSVKFNVDPKSGPQPPPK